MTDQTLQIVVGVDDDIRIRESLKSLIESAGFTSLVFTSAEEFLRSGNLAKASCLITDVRMPAMDGIDLQRRVRLNRPELPVIFISGHNDDDHNDDEIRRKALEGGAIAFMYKPFDPGDLLAAINQALSDCSRG